MDSIFVMFTCLFLLSSEYSQADGNGNETDRAVLLEFKTWISDDPDRIFPSWNETVDFCRWQGITCGGRHLPRVTKLELPGSRLQGSLSPYIGNLTFLRILNINNNGFTGKIPHEIGKLRRLTVLGLDNNSFIGQLPQNISGCMKLREILLGSSKLAGEVPREFAALSELRIFQISKNNFTGKFPDFVGNLSSLEIISGAYNNFDGTIPASLGRLQKLRQLLLGGNSFSGTVPASIFNMTILEYLEFGRNKLEGSLPRDLGITLPNILFISFGYNHLTGIIPRSIANATNLLRLQIPRNNFSGSVPDLNNLNRLQWLIIYRNQLGRGKSSDLKFIKSLNSTELHHLAIHVNNFGGTLPPSVGNLSSNLHTLSINSNRLTGTIPSSIGNLHNLETLFIGMNPFTGILPGEISNLYKLNNLQAQYSGFSGEIPSSFGNLTMLTKLTLAGNELRGNIPASLGKCQNLIELDLSKNNLSGTIPLQVLSIPSLSSSLDLSRNNLIGALPNNVGDLHNLASLNVGHNRISGHVPDGLRRCTSLVELYLGNNRFEGNISSFLSPLKALQYVDLSRNNFSGQIPEFLGNFQLLYLNLSFNLFEGEVPDQGVFLNSSGISVIRNGNLCGGISTLFLPNCPTPKLKQRRKISFVVIIATTCGITLQIVVLLFLAKYICMKKNRRNVLTQSGLVSVAFFPQISYEDLLRATEGLNKNNLIGTGSFGSVFKGMLENGGKTVAIKVLDLRNRAASKSFMAECEALRNIRHRNLVKIFTACSSIDFHGNEFKALVYEYMENGSLEECLHKKIAPEGQWRTLSFVLRLNIAIEIACAMKYLHHDNEMPVIHCDLKPSNILLDAEMTAHVGDFGLSRILSSAEVVIQTSSVGVRGTIGYSPPEYGMGSDVSREGDVYSYGILLLEMFTGKRPTDNMFMDARNIRSYCEAALPERITEIADPALLSNKSIEEERISSRGNIREHLVRVFKVGIGCCRESPGERMKMGDAATMLRSIKASMHLKHHGLREGNDDEDNSPNR